VVLLLESPSVEFTKLFAKSTQSISGKATKCALKLPVAPPNFAE